MIRALFEAWERHEHLFRAMLEARATSTTVREFWDDARESFVPVGRRDDPGRAGRGRGARRASTPPRWPRCCSSSTTGCWSGCARRPAGPRAADRRGRRRLAAARSTGGPIGCMSVRRGRLRLRRRRPARLALRRRAATARRRAAGRPVVVMAHGLGGTKDSGLAPFAEGLAEAGLDVLAFDYRGFGASEGEPRQTISSSPASSRTTGPRWPPPATLPGVDRAGSCCGECRCPAATCCRPAARPRRRRRGDLHDPAGRRHGGRPAGRSSTTPPSSIARSTVAGLAQPGRPRLGGRAPVMMPVVGPPGEVGRARAARRLRELPRDRRPDLAQRDRRLGRHGAGRAIGRPRPPST